MKIGNWTNKGKIKLPDKFIASSLNLWTDSRSNSRFSAEIFSTQNLTQTEVTTKRNYETN
jgi:hypothetical protein